MELRGFSAKEGLALRTDKKWTIGQMRPIAAKIGQIVEQIADKMSR